MAASKSQFTIRPTTLADIPTYIDIGGRAFGGPGGIHTILYNSLPLCPESVEHMIDLRSKSLQSGKQRFYQADDPATRSMVAGSRWVIVPEWKDEDIEEEVKTVMESLAGIKEVRKGVCMQMFRELLEGKNKVLSGREKPSAGVVIIDGLFTNPDWQGKGAGKALLKGILEEADRLGYDTYLESSKSGKPLYEKCGFKEISLFRFDAGKVEGGEGVIDHWVGFERR